MLRKWIDNALRVFYYREKSKGETYQNNLNRKISSEDKTQNNDRRISDELPIRCSDTDDIRRDDSDDRVPITPQRIQPLLPGHLHQGMLRAPAGPLAVLHPRALVPSLPGVVCAGLPGTTDPLTAHPRGLPGVTTAGLSSSDMIRDKQGKTIVVGYFFLTYRSNGLNLIPAKGATLVDMLLFRPTAH